MVSECKVGVNKTGIKIEEVHRTLRCDALGEVGGKDEVHVTHMGSWVSGEKRNMEDGLMVLSEMATTRCPPHMLLLRYRVNFPPIKKWGVHSSPLKCA